MHDDDDDDDDDDDWVRRVRKRWLKKRLIVFQLLEIVDVMLSGVIVMH